MSANQPLKRAVSWTMTEEQRSIPVSVAALRAEGYSADDRNIVISLLIKYSTAERKYAVPVECFEDLVIDLKRLNASSP